MLLHNPYDCKKPDEIKGYYAALAQLEQYAAQNHPVTEKVIQTLHALVMHDGRTHITPTAYRDGQSDMTPWIDYFIEELAFACENAEPLLLPPHHRLNRDGAGWGLLIQKRLPASRVESA